MSEPQIALAVDIGLSRITAATSCATQGNEIASALFPLGSRGQSASSRVFISEDGTLHFGSAAEWLGVGAPERLVGEFVLGVGSDEPIIVGDRWVLAEELYARVCEWVVATVTEEEGHAPSVITITHPANWGGYRRDRITAALREVGIDDPILMSEPEAAARDFEASHPLAAGQSLAIYDLGGNRFTAAILRKRAGSDAGFEAIGEPVHLTNLGGADFDEALARYVQQAADVTVDRDDEATQIALGRLHDEVVWAKEALSYAADATVPVDLPSLATTVRVTRSEFEAMITASLDRTVDALDAAIHSSGVPSDRIEAIVLTGGSSRIPLVAQRLSERFDLPLVAETDPQGVIALGAAQAAHDTLAADPPAPSMALVRPDAAVPGSDLVASPRRVGALSVLRPAEGRWSWPVSPLLMAGAAGAIAIAIIFSSTSAAGTRWPDLVLESLRTNDIAPFSAGADLPPAPAPAPSSQPPSPAPEANPPAPESRSGDQPVRSIGVAPGATPPGAVPPSAPPPAQPQPTTAPADTPDPEPTPDADADATPPADTPPADTPPADTPPADDPPSDPPPSPDTSPPADPPPPEPTDPPVEPLEAEPPTDPGTVTPV